MSKLCGVCHFDLRPVSQEDRARIETALGSHGYVSPQEHSEAGLIMGWAAGCEPARGGGLVQSPDHGCCSWDGRLDNRADLLPLTEVPAECPDSALALNLYRKKDVDGFRDLVGDWSLSLWDANRRTMVLASDYAGIRPLYYHRGMDSLYWSSSLADLVRWTGITELDDVYAGSFLARGSAPARTPYAGIFSVPPGHALSISQDGTRKRAYWNLPIHQELRYQDERDYEDRLLDLFRESVQVRIGTDRPVCAELSGGLDSSSVVSMADRLRKEAPGPVLDLYTFSYTHDQCADEKYFREVERVCNLSACHMELQQYPPVAAEQAGAAPGWWQPRFRELSRRVAARGAGVFLTGQLGDCIMGNTLDDSDQVAGWLAKGRFRQAAREAYAWGRSLQVPIYPILWRGLREACSSWVPSANPRAAVGAIRTSTEDSLVEAFRTRLELDERERLGDSHWRHAPPGRRRRFRAIGELLEARTLEAPEALQHLSYTHPFAHRPLVEFMLTIPAQVVCRPDQPRRLMRRAFAGLLPPLVLKRKSKAAYTTTYIGALMPLAAALLKNQCEIQIVERGYVERNSLVSRLEKFTQGLDCNESQLRHLILFEFWLRNQVAPHTAQVSELAAS